MFGNSCGHLPYIRNFEEAHAHFNKTAKPRSAKWDDNERPLKDTRAWHYRIERRESDFGIYYDVILHRTAMGRFHAPRDGKRVELYSGHSSMMSKSFRSNVLHKGAAEELVTTDGTLVYVPINGGTDRLHDDMGALRDGMTFCTKLTFDDKDRLIVAESDHPQIVRRVANDLERTKRKVIKEITASAVMLAVMRMSQYRDECSPDRDLGKPFKGRQISFNQRRALEKLCVDPSQLTPLEWEEYFDFAGKVFDTLVSKRLYNEAEIMTGTWRTKAVTWDIDALQTPVTETEFSKVLATAILEVGGGHKYTDDVPIPKFSPPDAIPKSNAHVK